MERKCSNCGYQNQIDTTYCGLCGMLFKNPPVRLQEQSQDSPFPPSSLEATNEGEERPLRNNVVVVGLKRFVFLALFVLVAWVVLSKCGKADSKLIKGFSDSHKPLEIVQGNVKWTFSAGSSLNSDLIFFDHLPVDDMGPVADAFFALPPTAYGQFQELIRKKTCPLIQKNTCPADFLNAHGKLYLILTDNPAVLHKIRPLKRGQSIKLSGYHLSETHQVIRPQQNTFAMELPTKNAQLIFLQDVIVQPS